MPDATRGDQARIAPLFTWRSAVSDSDLSPTMRHCLLALSLYMNERGGSAFPGSARLAHDTGYHKSTVKESLREAYKMGWLRVVEQGGTGKGGIARASEYVASTPDDFVPDSYRVPTTPGRPDRGTRVPTTPTPGPQDAPISSVISAGNSHAREADPKCVQCQGRGVKGYAPADDPKTEPAKPVPCDCTLPDYTPRPEPSAPPPGVAVPAKRSESA